jgi:hypothetical protein
MAKKTLLPMRICSCGLIDPKTGEICCKKFRPVKPQHMMLKQHKNRLNQRAWRERQKKIKADQLQGGMSATA